ALDPRAVRPGHDVQSHVPRPRVTAPRRDCGPWSDSRCRSGAASVTLTRVRPLLAATLARHPTLGSVPIWPYALASCLGVRQYPVPSTRTPLGTETCPTTLTNRATSQHTSPSTRLRTEP